MDLNAAQRRAVEAADGPIAIIAGPGTGKTKTLTARIAHLIQTGRARPEEILALTFTKKAAEEMRTRLLNGGMASVTVTGGREEDGRSLEDRTRGAPIQGKEDVLLQPTDRDHKASNFPLITTFHALCHKMLGDERDFITEPERLAIIKKLPKPATYKNTSARELGLLISRAKNLADDAPELAGLVTAHDAALAARGLRDFDDLLLQVRDQLTRDPAKSPNYRYILVDEFQDTNRLQYDLLRLLATDNLFVIGDPNQSIYGFRGASGDIFAQFAADFPQHTQITLTVNYRSAPELVTLGNHVFPQAKPLSAERTTTGHVQATQVLNEYSEAHWVVNAIQQAIGGADMQSASAGEAKRGLRDFAIVYRSRRAAQAVQKCMAESGLPFQIVGDGSPYDRPDLQKLMALLRYVAGQDVVVEGFTSRQLEPLLQPVPTDQPPAQIARALIARCGLELNSHLSQLVGTLVRFKTLGAALAFFDTLADGQFYDPQADGVTLLTIHAAKGLEFPHVFLVGAEEGLLPSEKSDESEERRLFYVAVTRAKDQLDITHAMRRAGQPAHASRFITELPLAVMSQTQDPNLAGDKHRAQKRQAKRAQTNLF